VINQDNGRNKPEAEAIDLSTLKPVKLGDLNKLGLTESQLQKLDPYFRFAYAQDRLADELHCMARLAAPVSPATRAEFQAAGAVIMAEIGDIITLRFPSSSLKSVLDIGSLKSLSCGRPLHPEA
jgi:hypothetical protein